ncbi:hypothetical protein HQ560_20335, partial [bacterium]|nr:hypothetical protein [bacterium]
MRKILVSLLALLAATARADAPLRAAIDDLMATFGDQYPKGAGYLARLD